MRHHASEPVRRFLLARTIQSISLIAGFLVVAAPSLARADNQVRAVRLSNVVGAVQVSNGNDQQFSQAYPNMPLMQGSKLQTGDDGRAEIQFEDGSIARLTPNSSLSLPQLTRDTAGNTSSEIDLLTGLSYVELSGAAHAAYVVRFGDTQVTNNQPVKFRVKLDANPPELAVLDGTAHVTGGTAYAVDVHENETIRFDASDSGRYFLAENVDGDSWDQWNADRDDALGRMAAQETREARLNGDPNNPAWSDLDYYGTWYPNPAGGMFWAPYGVGSGWDPYGSGYWGYYGGGGYSWISGYPWGWLPYHCGGWNYFGGYGWGWMPGQCGGGYAPVSPIYNYPSGYTPVVRPVPFSPGHGHLTNPPHRLITVNRGPEATFINPAVHAHPEAIAVNGHPVAPVAKTINPNSVFIQHTAMNDGQRPGGVLAIRSETIASTPVFRPVAPVMSHPGGSSGYSSGMNSFAGSSRVSAPSGGRASFSPSGGHVSSGGGSSMGGGGHVSTAAPSGGGGHVK